MLSRSAVLKALDTPMTEHEVAAATNLHIVGVLYHIKELLASKEIVNIGIRKIKRMPHSNIFASLTTMKAQKRLHTPAEVDKLIIEALTEHGPMVRSQIIRVTGLTEDRAARGIKRAVDAKLVEQDGKRKNAPIWRLYVEPPVFEIQTEYKTKFVNGKNPWL